MTTLDDNGAAISAALATVEAFTEAFNARDPAGMDAMLHFPHAILVDETLVIWKTPGQLPADFFEDLAATRWSRSTYHGKRAVLVGPRKVHFVLEYSRDDAEGRPLSQHANLWIVTLEQGRWGIKQRSY